MHVHTNIGESCTPPRHLAFATLFLGKINSAYVSGRINSNYNKLYFAAVIDELTEKLMDKREIKTICPHRTWEHVYTHRSDVVLNILHICREPKHVGWLDGTMALIKVH